MATVPQVYDGEVEVNVEPNALEPTRQELEELVRITTDRVIDHVATLGAQRASDTSGLDDAARAVVEPLPELGMPLEQLLDLFFGRSCRRASIARVLERSLTSMEADCSTRPWPTSSASPPIPT